MRFTWVSSIVMRHVVTCPTEYAASHTGRVIFKFDDWLPDLNQTWAKRFLVRAHFSFKLTLFFTLATLLHRTVDCKIRGFTKSGYQISLLYVAPNKITGLNLTLRK